MPIGPGTAITKDPNFVFDTSDSRCLQCCLEMALHSVGHRLSAQEIDSLTRFEPGLNTQWSIATVGLTELVPGIRLFSQLNFGEYALDGEKYLERVFETTWMDHQRKMSSPAFKKEQQGAIDLVGRGKWSPCDLGPDDFQTKRDLIDDILSRGSLLVASINVKILWGTEWDGAHAVLVYRSDYPRSPREATHIYLHDPAFTDGAAVHVSKDLLAQSMRTHAMELPRKLSARE
jgi:hypothetical protein